MTKLDNGILTGLQNRTRAQREFPRDLVSGLTLRTDELDARRIWPADRSCWLRRRILDYVRQYFRTGIERYVRLPRSKCRVSMMT